MHPPENRVRAQYRSILRHRSTQVACSARPRGRERDSTRPGSRCGERGRGVPPRSRSRTRSGGRFIFLEFRSFWSHVLTNKHIGHGATHRLAQHASDHWRALTATPETRLACSRWGTSAGATSATDAPSASAAPTSRSTTDTSPPAARSLPPGRGADGAPLGCSPCRAALTRPSVPAAC